MSNKLLPIKEDAELKGVRLPKSDASNSNMTNIGHETSDKYDSSKNDCTCFLTFVAYHKVCSQDIQAWFAQSGSERMV